MSEKVEFKYGLENFNANRNNHVKCLTRDKVFCFCPWSDLTNRCGVWCAQFDIQYIDDKPYAIIGCCDNKYPLEFIQEELPSKIQ